MNKKYAELKIGDKVYNLPIIKGTESDYAIDISNLRSETGFVTLDYGFKNTGSTQSKITFIDGEYPQLNLSERIYGSPELVNYDECDNLLDDLKKSVHDEMMVQLDQQLEINFP